MGAISTNKLGGAALIVGPLVAIVFFLLQPAGLLVGRLETGSAEEVVTVYAEYPELTRITSIVIALGLVTMLFGQSVVWSALRDSGKPEGLARYGLLFLLVGTAGWTLVQGIHFMLAGADSMSVALAAYEVDTGLTLLGGVVVSAGFFLFSLGLVCKGGLHKTVGFVVAVVSVVAFASLVFGINSPGNLDTAVRISRLCYFPWVIWSVWLGVGLLKEE